MSEVLTSVLKVIPFIDLFAGCGGMTSGFAATQRFRPVAAVERDRHAAATYAANYGEHVFAGDIVDWLEGSTPAAALVIGGPPCQGFSALGRQDPLDPRNDLWLRYIEVLDRVKPAFFVLENVPQFLRSPQFRAMSDAARPGRRLGMWELEPFELVADDYGVAQKRRRAVVIGRRRGTRPVGRPEVLPKRATVASALKDLPERVIATELPSKRLVFDGKDVPGTFSLAELHVNRRPSPISEARFRAIPPGGNRFDLPDELKAACWRRHTSGSGDVMGRLSWDKPAVTIRTEFQKPEKGRYLHPSEHRPITLCEAALLQGFDNDHVWCGTKTSIAKQIGNAVPPPLARAVAQRLLDRL